MGVPLWNSRRNTRLALEMSQEQQVQKLQEQAKLLRKKNTQEHNGMKEPKTSDKTDNTTG